MKYMGKKIAIVRLFTILLILSKDGNATCPSSAAAAKSPNGQCWKFNNSAVNWDMAHQICNSMGAVMASVFDSNDFSVFSSLAGTTQTWTNLKTLSSPLSYKMYYNATTPYGFISSPFMPTTSGHSNTGVYCLRLKGGNFCDNLCTSSYAFICVCANISNSDMTVCCDGTTWIECMPNFYQDGPLSTVCNETTNQWSPSVSCSPQCPLISIYNGTVTYSDEFRRTSSTATVECQTPLVPIGATSLTCDTHTWLPEIPVCGVTTTYSLSAVYESPKGDCWKYNNSPVTWSAAHSICNSKGGVMAPVFDSDDFDLFRTLARTPETWTNLMTLTNSSYYQMYYNETTTYSQTSLFMPNNDCCNEDGKKCLRLNSAIRFWDKDCSSNFSFICSFPKTTGCPNISNSNMTLFCDGTASIECMPNFYQDGPKSIICNDVTKSWSPDVSCVQQCPEFSVDNATIDYSDTFRRSGSTATILCHSPLVVTGASVLTCENQTWSSASMPICDIMTSTVVSTTKTCGCSPNSKHCPCYKDPLNPTERLVVTVIHPLGCTLLIGFVSASFLLFLVFRIFSLERNLQMGQEISLVIMHSIILTQAFEQQGDTTCILVAIMLQYFTITNFAFISLEALQTFCILQNVVSFGGFFSTKVNILIGVVSPAAIVVLTAPFFYKDYITRYSCWLNIGSRVAMTTVVPLIVASILFVVLSEAAAINESKRFPLTPEDVYNAALIRQKGALFVWFFNLMSVFTGASAVYKQDVAAYAAVLGFNATLGVCVFIIHTFSNDKVFAWLKQKLCKKK